MSNPIIGCFRGEFDRFHALLERQIAVCPDELWEQKVGGYLFWQQILHSLACVFLYACPEKMLFEDLPYRHEVLMLSEVPDFTVTKEEMRELAQEAKTAAHQFIGAQSLATLTHRHKLMSHALGKEVTNQTALIALLRHNCYHLGACDAALRDRGIPGVY